MKALVEECEGKNGFKASYFSHEIVTVGQAIINNTDNHASSLLLHFTMHSIS